MDIPLMFSLFSFDNLQVVQDPAFSSSVIKAAEKFCGLRVGLAGLTAIWH
jgi:hypothetical protein